MDEQKITNGKEDLSSKTILILAVLVVIVSLVGALIQFQSTFSSGQVIQPQKRVDSSVANVGFVIGKPLTQTDTTAGKSVFVIAK